jgi:preprotein translocase subunit SecF
MDLLKDTKIDFLKYKTIAILLSVAIIAAGVFLILTRGLRYGVDFTGGTAVHVKFRSAADLDTIRQKLRENGFADSGVQSFNDPTQVLIRLPQKVSSGDQVEELSRRVARILSPTDGQQGQRDLNLITELALRSYIQAKNPWNTNAPNAYQAEVKKLIQIRVDNGGLFPTFESMTAVDPKVLASLKQEYYVSDLAILSTEYVGPQVGSELREQAKLAVAWTVAALLIYVWFRFEFLWGLSAIACLVHDVLVTLAFFAFTQREISLTVVAALLAIVGYSINDTIVIYDRVRENLRSMRTRPLAEVINLSLNQMLGRSLIINGLVLTVSIILFFFGGEVINDFAFAMLIGGVAGTYSTIYIAGAIIIFYDQYIRKKKPAPAKAKVSQKAS